MTKFRVVEIGNKGFDPHWIVEQFKWGILGKRWYRVSNFYQCKAFALDGLDWHIRKAKKLKYKKIIKEIEV